ncbi:VOC family protein [Methylophilus sp.]|uniref:VOC family protein n=1 Tax=Methylophilus sp. TaxID=29541 RepID=UPI0040369209
MTSSTDALAPADAAALATIIIYARDIPKTVAFYRDYFGFETTGEIVDGLVELNARQGGASILVHQAAKSVKLGQVGVKLCFAVQDVAQFVQAAQAQGLAFGAIHQAAGYQFANAKDPDNNSISISSRTFRTTTAV